jgi:hypothetical protein
LAMPEAPRPRKPSAEQLDIAEFLGVDRAHPRHRNQILEALTAQYRRTEANQAARERMKKAAVEVMNNFEVYAQGGRGRSPAQRDGEPLSEEEAERARVTDEATAETGIDMDKWREEFKKARPLGLVGEYSAARLSSSDPDHDEKVQRLEKAFQESDLRSEKLRFQLWPAFLRATHKIDDWLRLQR